MEQIPIRINKKDSNSTQIAFKILPIQKKFKLSHNRQKSYHSSEKQSHQIKNLRKHDTLDPKRSKGQYRYRRISSSGGTHKFPKDFFNNSDPPKTPIKIRFSRNKKQDSNLIQSNASNQPLFNDSSLNNIDNHKKKYTLESPSKNVQLQQQSSQVETPKFNNKFFGDEDFFQAKSKTTNRKIKMDEYLSHKKGQFPKFFKNTNKQQLQNEKDQPELTCQSLRLNQKTTLFELSNNQNNLKQLLLETLGKRQNIIQQTSNQTKKRKRIQSNMDKQNRIQVTQRVRTNKKSIKAFLSTKGINWKILRKINQMQGSTDQNNYIFAKSNQKKTPLGLRKGLTQKLNNNDNILGNTFRIRKCT